MKMYNEQIENLIRLSVMDGTITEKEREVLFKKAEEAGIDLEEFKIVLDARLYEQKQKNEQSVPSLKNVSNENDSPDDKPGIGWQILALLVPIAGLIMYFNNKEKFPKKASSYATMAAIGFIINLIFYMT